MDRLTLTRSALALSVLSAAFSAQAVQIGLTSVGTLDFSSSPFVTLNESVLLQQGGLGSLSSLSLKFTNGFFPVEGSGTYSGPDGSLDFDFAYTSDTTAGGTQSLLGTWTVSGGTGSYANVAGWGTITTNYDHTNGLLRPSFTTFRGTLETVPEPASLAILGAGALAMLRRRTLRR